MQNTKQTEMACESPVKYSRYISGHQDQLEAIVDSLGVKGTLEALAQVCFDKGEHLATNWQDYSSGQLYDEIANAINQFAYNKIEKHFGFTG